MLMGRLGQMGWSNMGHEWGESGAAACLCLDFLTFTFGRWLLRPVDILLSIGNLRLDIVVEHSKGLVHFFAQFFIVINPRLVSSEQGNENPSPLTMTSAQRCPSPEACR